MVKRNVAFGLILMLAGRAMTIPFIGRAGGSGIGDPPKAWIMPLLGGCGSRRERLGSRVSRLEAASAIFLARRGGLECYWSLRCSGRARHRGVVSMARILHARPVWTAHVLHGGRGARPHYLFADALGSSQRIWDSLGSHCLSSSFVHRHLGSDADASGLEPMEVTHAHIPKTACGPSRRRHWATRWVGSGVVFGLAPVHHDRGQRRLPEGGGCRDSRRHDDRRGRTGDGRRRR